MEGCTRNILYSNTNVTMRTLVVTRGLPGSGKSTFLRERGWAPYILEADALRLMHCGPEMQPDGAMSVPGKADSAVWKLLYSLLEERMREGAFSVVDATHLHPQSFSIYRRLAKRYRYSMYVLDFTDVPEAELLRRNGQRGLRRVPEPVLLRMFRRLRATRLPGWVRLLPPAEADTLLRRPLELDAYRRVLHIGDVHGCYTALRLLLPEAEPQADTFYIFHGDLADRGMENAEVVRFLSTWSLFPNVVVLEGNHEASLRAFAGIEIEGAAPAEYELYTRREWEEKGLSPETAGELYRRTWQCCSYTYRGRNVFACHGGVPNMAGNPLYINTRQLIGGVGGYGQAARIARTWDATMPPDCFQVHGHRNRERLPVQASERVFNLEGQVEFGGCLRAVELTEQGFHPVEIPNPVPAVAGMQCFTPWLFPQNGGEKPPVPVPPQDTATPREEPESVRRLRANPVLQETACGAVSAFAPRRCYKDGQGEDFDARACAFFVNTVSGQMVARGYNELPCLYKVELRYPLSVYVQENGFLGLAGYDRLQGEPVFATHRSLSGPRIRLFRDLLRRRIDSEELAAYLKKSCTTLAFEVVGCAEDPHIVPYDHAEVILLDEIRNTPEFRSSPYSRLSLLANLGRTSDGLRIKRRLGGKIRSQEERNAFLSLHQEDEVEGFVFEDADGRRAYFKTMYYQRWCRMRAELQKWRKGLPGRETIPACYPFLLWAHDYLRSHPDELARGIGFHTLRRLFRLSL